MLINKPPVYENSMSRNLPHNPVSQDQIYQNHLPRGHVSHASKHGTTSKFGMASTHGHDSGVGNDSMLNFYPHLMQPTRMSEAVGAGSSNASSNRSPSTRMSLKNAATLSTAKTVSFYRSGDVHMQAFKVAITKRHFRTFDSLLESLSDRIPLPFGVRTVSTPKGTHGISRLDEFEDGKSYVCSDKKTVKPLNLNAVRSSRPPWFISKPRTRNRVVAQLVRPADSETLRVPLRLTQVKTPKKIVIVRNGDPSFRHTLLLSRRTPQSFESILEDIGEIFRMRAHKLYTSDGRRVDSLQSLFLGPNVYVAAGREAFQPMEYRIKKVAIADDKRDPLSSEGDLIKERFPKELKKTKGKWRVTVATSELPAAGTDSRVMINVYGVKGNSGPILLSDGNKTTFRSGNEDDFVIHVGSIGDIRKIRIAHDNSGTSPGWLCDSITLTDVTTGDKLEFHCNKWLSRDEDDGEICREIAAQLPEKPVLPEITYVVSVTTGNLWNAGTDADVLVTLYGDLGDCGPRLLQHGGKPHPQVKGTTDVYRMRAVTLGNMFRLVVGHDCQEPGEGWFLERITVKEDRVGSDEWVFECNRWFDAGEDDGKTVRELYAEADTKILQPSRGKSQTEKHKEDLWWDLEKWKFQRGNQIVLMNHATLKAVRVRSDAGIDALGDPSHPQCAFEVLRRRSNVRVFSNVVQPSFHIALDQNRMLGQGKGGTFCEFHVKVQKDRSVLLESCKYSTQHATFDPSGKPADTRGNANIPGRTFTVYVKGCFRHDALVLLNTSPTQALAVASNGDVIGTGRRSDVDIGGSKRPDNEARMTKQFALFRVIKVAEGVRMFQCEEDRRKFLRIKDGQCDGLGSGDVYCHFKVQKYKIGGYVTLQSMKNRGVFVGLNTNGRARPTVDTGDANTQFFPEVVKFGLRRTGKADQWITPEPSFVTSAREVPKPPSSQRIVSPEKPKPSPSQVTLKEREDSNTGPKDGDYRVYVTTGNSGSIETVTLFAYGDRGQSDPIILGKGTEGGVFQCGQTDEFQVNLISIGAIRKIRIGMEECSPDCDWRLKQVKMKDMSSNEILRFKFNRWLSRTRDDGATVRELPALAQDGSPELPVLRYLVLVRTGKASPPPSSKSNKPTKNELGNIPQPEIYICIHGENFDTGRRLLMRKPPQTPDSSLGSNKPLFSAGQLDRFEIEAVSLGELTKCVISCPKMSPTATSRTPWFCDEIVIRESDGASNEYVFPCKKWLGARKPKAKTQISINLGEKREVKRKQSENTEYQDGDWKISVTTGAQEDSGTSANVMFVAYSSDGTSSGPVLLGSGVDGLFERGTTERFKVNLIKLDDLYKIRLSQDTSGPNPSWFVERVKMKDMNSDVTYTLDVHKWISLSQAPHQMAVEIPIPKPGEELTPVFMYKVLIYTGGILGSDTEANVFINIHGNKGDTGRRPLQKSLNNDVKFQESQIDIFEVEAVDLGELVKIEIGHDGIGPGNGWFLHKVIIKESDISQKDYIFFLNRWLDDGQDDGKIERVIEVEHHAQYIATRRAVGSSAYSTPDPSKVCWSPEAVRFSSDQVYPKSSSCASSAQGATSTSPARAGTSPRGVVAANSDPTWKMRHSEIPRYRRSASYRNTRLFKRLVSSVHYRSRILRSDGNTTSESSTEDPLPSTTPSSPLRDLVPTFYAWQQHQLVKESSPNAVLLSPEGDSSSRPSPTVRTRRGDALRKVNTKRGLQPLGGVLTPPDFSEPQDTATEGEYKVYITTGSQSSEEPCPDDTLVSMVIYGDDGKTGQILLQPAPSRQSQRTNTPKQASLFQPGQTDEFKIDVPEIGSIYKIRMSINEECDCRGIFLDRILLVQTSSKRETHFVCNRWLSTVEDDQETTREFPVTTEGEQQLPVHPYFVTVTTGDRPAGDTDANVFLTLRGERGDTGRRRLNNARLDAHAFQRGKPASFVLEAVDLGRLQEIVVSHDGKGYGSGWFLDKITVREQEFAALEWVFPCHMWLDDHVGDCKSVRRLSLLGTCEVSSGEDELLKLRVPPSSEESQAGIVMKNYYIVQVSVGEVMTQGNDGVTLYGYVEGEDGCVGPFLLGEWIPGDEKEFETEVEMDSVGEITKLRVEMPDSDKDLNLFLIDVTIRNPRTNDLLSFSFHRKFRTSTGCTVKELPALRSNRDHRNLVTYMVNLDMLPSNDEVGAEGTLSLKLTGENGTSGFRTLFRRTNGFKATKQEKGYSFEMTAVDLGKLRAATLVYTSEEGSLSEGGWNIGVISVKIPDLPNFFAGEYKPEPTYSSKVEHEFNSVPTVSRVEKEYELEMFEAGRELNRTFRKASAVRPRKNVKSLDVPSTGEWVLALTTAKYNESSIFNRISARVFGTRGCSDIIDVSHDVTRERLNKFEHTDLATRVADIKLTEDLGQLYMIRLTISKDSDIRIYKIKLKDIATEQEYLAHITVQQRLYAVADDGGRLSFDLPLLRPDEEGIPHQKYDIHVKTGSDLASATDAYVKLNLIGTNSETGFRPLAALSEDPDVLYSPGQIDRFALETADVGEPRKIMVAHDGKGRGSGWFLDDVTVSLDRSEINNDFKFFFNKWLDDCVDDKLTEREASIVATRVLQPEVDVSKSRGKWNCELISREELLKQKSYDIRICFCFSGGRTRDVVRQVTKATEEFDVILIQEQSEEDENLDAELQEDETFIKIRAEIESTNEAIKKRWPLEELLMTNETSQEKLRFVFDDVPTWEGSLRGHVRELPVWRPNQALLPVIEYYVIFNTSNDSNPDSHPSLVTIQLQGTGGNTGWRKIVSPENSENRFQPGRIDVFTIEAVDLGESVNCVSLNVGGPLEHPWLLERVKVKRGFYADEELIFECAKEIKEDEVIDLTDPSLSSCLPVPSLRKSGLTAVANTSFDVTLQWTGLSEVLSRKSDSPESSREAIPPVHLQLVGSKGISELSSINLLEAESGRLKRRVSNIKVQVVAAKFGDLRKVAVGFLEVVDQLPPEFKLFKLQVINQQTNDHYSFRPNRSFVGQVAATSGEHETGLNWLELVAVLPRQDKKTILNMVDYHVTIRTTDRESAGTDANVYVTLVGSNGDSGKRWMLQTRRGDEPEFKPGGTDEFLITSVDVGSLKQVIIGRNGRLTSAGWHLTDVSVTSLSDAEKKLFVCGQWLSNLESESFIEKTLEVQQEVVGLPQES